MPGARDGQLRIHRGTDDPPWALQLFDDDLGLWLTVAQANIITVAQLIFDHAGTVLVDTACHPITTRS